jgi:seryl-tRNA synthetase
MTAKEYLIQAHYLDERITSKTQQIASLNELATRCTSTISDMPRNPNRGGSRMEDCIVKIIDLEEKLKLDIEKLINLKKEIMEVIKAVPNIEYQTLLEKRYLCFITWEQISVDMCYSIQHIHRMHSLALKEIIVPNEDESKCDSMRV